MHAIDVPNIAQNSPMWLLILTTAVGAIEGAIIGRKDASLGIDIVGITVFALFLGLGGGFARDTMLGNTPFLALRTPWYIITVLCAVVLVLIIGRWIPVDSKVFILLDALTLGLYAVIGAQAAIDYGLPDIGAITVGLFASLTGGVVVSLLKRETPEILVRGKPYAILALIGVIIYVTFDQWSGGVAALLCVISVIVLRFAAMKWNIRTSPVRPIDPPSSA